VRTVRTATTTGTRRRRHPGERVLTPAETKEYSGGGGGGDDVEITVEGAEITVEGDASEATIDSSLTAANGEVRVLVSFPAAETGASVEALQIQANQSQANFLRFANRTDGLTVENARPGAQGDRAIVDVVDRMGAPIEWNRQAGRIEVESAGLSGVTVDVGDTPDLLPTIAALGAAADGDTRIENCEHVRYKETDRVTAMAEELRKLGAETEEFQDELVVRGGESHLEGGRVEGRGDHRIVMALSVAALACSDSTVVSGGEHVDVSFPNFFDVLSDLGASVSR